MVFILSKLKANLKLKFLSVINLTQLNPHFYFPKYQCTEWKFIIYIGMEDMLPCSLFDTSHLCSHLLWEFFLHANFYASLQGIGYYIFVSIFDIVNALVSIDKLGLSSMSHTAHWHLRKASEEMPSTIVPDILTMCVRNVAYVNTCSCVFVCVRMCGG